MAMDLMADGKVPSIPKSRVVVTGAHRFQVSSDRAVTDRSPQKRQSLTSIHTSLIMPVLLTSLLLYWGIC